MPKMYEKDKHSDHHGMYGPHGVKAEEEHTILKGKPFPLTSKPKHTYVMNDPNKPKQRKG